MVLEATMIVLDNSEWMRNGDFSPSRSEAQHDAVNILFRSKTGSNPENTVGVLTMAGKGPEVLVTLTSDLGKVLNAIHRVSIGGNPNFTTGIQVAQLALKHRQNKNQRQRIIVFVGSPIHENEKDLVRLAKKMKKNNVAVDIINYGETSVNETKLQAFMDAVTSSSNSYLLNVHPGPQLLSDMVISSPIISEDGMASSLGRGDNSNFEFGVDPELEPELAMALRLSLEEERARQAAQGGVSADSAAAPPSTSDLNRLLSPDEVMDDSEEAQLQRALALSLQTEEAASTQPMETDEASQAPELLSNIISSLPGVSSDDPRIQAALANLGNEKKDKDKEDKSKNQGHDMEE
ncbi:proteasome regulatory particle base subunit rpn10 [Entomophthora muscae]|uniref:Proteasome regulatory particle base subunit rpn10 n=1 Tax=Entomophthora muscae TaxID=34485 RepID=A0ACC2U3V3_9FUNG|nr:proteasome regulatory particle base subunit rpn10 [Entomophthora muscae]